MASGLRQRSTGLDINNDKEMAFTEEEIEKIYESPIMVKVINQIINSGGRFSLHADSMLTIIRVASVMRLLIWLIPFIAGLASNFLIYMNRFGIMTLVMVPVAVENFISLTTASQLVIFYLIFVEIGLAVLPSLIITLKLGLSLWNCLAVGVECPTGDDGDLKRVLELPFDIILLSFSAVAVMAVYELYMSYNSSSRKLMTTDWLVSKLTPKTITD